MARPAFVLGSGINAMWVARSLGRRLIPTYVFTQKPEDIAYHSRYVTACEYCDDSKAPDTIEQLKQAAGRLNAKPVVLIATDSFLEIVSDHKEEISEFATVGLPATEIVNTVINKGTFGEFCTTHELPAPSTWVVESQKQYDSCKAIANFPVILKPVVSHTAGQDKFLIDGAIPKVVVIEDAAELERRYSELKGSCTRFLVQEYIKGDDSNHYSYCSYWNSDLKEIAGVGIRKLRVHPIHGGIGTFAEIYNDSELVGAAREVVEKLGFTGISSVCFKRDARTGELRIHEMNGRFPVWHSASHLCGIDLPYIAYQDMVGADVQRAKPVSAKGKWVSLKSDIGSFRQYRQAGELGLFQWLRSLFQVRLMAEFAMDDWRPFVFFVGQILIRIWRRMISKVSTVLRLLPEKH